LPQVLDPSTRKVGACWGPASPAGKSVRPELQERKNPQGRSRLLWMAHSRRGRERALGYKESRRVRYEHAKNQERSFGAQSAPQDDSGNQFRRRRTHGTEGEILRGKGDRYDLEWPRGLHNAPAFPAGPRSGGIIVGIICDDVSGRSAHALAERQLERESRVAGKRLGTKDLRIDDRAIGTNGTGVSKREGWEFRATHRKRRGASRRST
jgi:hypothetical protein